MAEHLPEREQNLPRVIVAEHVIQKIVQGALLYPEPETGEAMVGLIAPQTGAQEPDIYILDTISPGEHAIREWGMFEQGSDWQADVFNWHHANWESFRDLRRASYSSAIAAAAKWDLPLSHVGDWHKQPGSMIAPSAGDAATASAMIDDVETPIDCLVAPIVTMYPAWKGLPESESEDDDESADDGQPAEAEASDEAEVTKEDGDGPSETESEELAEAEQLGDPTANLPPNALVRTTADGKYIVRVDFWYMSRRNRWFMAVKPTILQDEWLPKLPPVAWHLAHPRRFNQEFSLLTEAGYMVDMVRWDADGRPPYEICFSVYQPGRSHVIILVTPAEYPAQQPAIRIAPLVSVAEDEDVFEKLYAASNPILPTQMPDWDWDSKRTLIELVWHVEKVLEKDTTV